MGCLYTCLHDWEKEMVCKSRWGLRQGGSRSSGHWFSECGPGAAAAAPRGHLLEVQIIGPHHRPAESGSLGVGSTVFNRPPRLCGCVPVGPSGLRQDNNPHQNPWEAFKIYILMSKSLSQICEATVSGMEPRNIQVVSKAPQVILICKETQNSWFRKNKEWLIFN